MSRPLRCSLVVWHLFWHLYWLLNRKKQVFLRVNVYNKYDQLEVLYEWIWADGNSENVIFDYIMNKNDKQVAYKEVREKRPENEHVLAIMLINEILELNVVNDELVYL